LINKIGKEIILNGGSILKYEESLPHEIEAEIQRMPVAYLPWGAHEWHGAHNPVGVDGIKAEFLAQELCKETGGIVFPTVYCGHYPTSGYEFPCSLDFSRHTVEWLARDYLRELAKMGFEVIVLLMGHWPGPHIEIIRGVADDFNNQNLGTVAWVVQDNEMTENFGFLEDHGGIGETSYMMLALPGRVDLSRLPQDHPLTFETDGIAGPDPHDASAERGRQAADIYVREAAKRIRETLEN